MSVITEKAATFITKMGTLLRPKTEAVALPQDTHEALAHLLAAHDKEAVQNYINRRLPYPTVMNKIYEENEEFFSWLVDRKLLFDDVYTILEAYSLSVVSTEKVIDAGIRGKQLNTAVSNFTKNASVATYLLEHRLPQLTHELSDSDLHDLEPFCSLQPELLELLAAGDSDLRTIIGYITHLEEAQVIEMFVEALKSSKIQPNEFQKFFSMLEQNSETVRHLLVEKAPFALYEQILFFESNLTQYSQVTLVTHALRAEHYKKMLQVAEERGTDVGFQLRSKEENNALGIGVKSYSPNGRGNELEAGEEFISTTLNAVAGLYGDIVFVGKAATLLQKHFTFRALDFSLQNGLHARGELSVFTRAGLSIHAAETLRTAEKYLGQGNTEQAESLVKKAQQQLEIFEQLPTDIEAAIATLRTAAEKQIQNRIAEGISLLNSDFLCLVPQDQYDQLRTAIDASALDETSKVALIAQLIPFEGSLNLELVAQLRNPNEFSRKTEFLSKILGDKLLTATRNDAEIALSMPGIKVTTGLYKFSETPTIDFASTQPDNPTLQFKPDNCVALLYSLQNYTEWSFLRDLPRIYWGSLQGPLSWCVKRIYDETMQTHNVLAKDLQATELLKQIGTTIQKPVHELAESDQAFVVKIFALDIPIDQNKSAISLWREKTLQY